jgi:hypothetical protein
MNYVTSRCYSPLYATSITLFFTLYRKSPHPPCDGINHRLYFFLFLVVYTFIHVVISLFSIFLDVIIYFVYYYSLLISSHTSSFIYSSILYQTHFLYCYISLHFSYLLLIVILSFLLIIYSINCWIFIHSQIIVS